MAFLYIAEFEQLGDVKSPSSSKWSGSVQLAGTPPVVEQVVAIGAGSIQSAVFNVRTKYIRLNTDAICSVAFAVNPTATTSNMRLTAGQTEYFGVSSGTKLAVIANI